MTLMQNSNEYPQRVVAELRAHMARQRIKGYALADTIGVNAMWVSRRMSGRVELTIEDFVRICDALDVSPNEVLTAANQPEPAAASS